MSDRAPKAMLWPSPQKSPQNSFPWVIFNAYGLVRTFQVIVNTLKRLASAVQLRPWPPHFKALIRIRRFSSVRSQSALIRRVAKNRHQHLPRGGHAVLADSVAVKLERQLDIAVSKQSLHSLWIGSDANQKRRETVAMIVKSEPAGIVLHQSPVFVAMR